MMGKARHAFAGLISLLLSLQPARAETLAEQIGALFKDICIAAPEVIMANGERFAAARQWKLVRAGRTPLPILHNDMRSDDGPSLVRSWRFDLPQAPDVRLVISIAGPELPGVRHSVCALSWPTPEFITAQLAAEIEGRFGAELVEAGGPPTNVKHTWHFKHQYPDRSQMLTFMDFQYPRDGKWDVLIDAMRCRK